MPARVYLFLTITPPPTPTPPPQHASIAFNRNSSSWELTVFSKNGVTVDGLHYQHVPSGGNSPPVVPLNSVSALRIGPISAYFTTAMGD
jgi:hypothetical protein